MLKINPKKDIKELERFGFEYDEDIKQYFYTRGVINNENSR